MQIERTRLNALVENQFPDGSKLIVDAGNEKAYALNGTAGAAWDACSSSTTLSGVSEGMRRAFDPAVTEDVAEAAILQLEEQNLVATSGASGLRTRRELIASLAAVAAPIVVSMTLAEQRGHAVLAASKTTPPPCATCE